MKTAVAVSRGPSADCSAAKPRDSVAHQPALELLRLDVEAPAQPVDDRPFGPGPDDRHRHHQLAGQPPDGPLALGLQREPCRPVEALGLRLGIEGESPGPGLPIDRDLLDPGQLSPPQQTPGR